jgi:hypothetical protein
MGLSSPHQNHFLHAAAHIISVLLLLLLWFCVSQSLRETYNTAKYEEVLERINGRLGPEYDIDRSVLNTISVHQAYSVGCSRQQQKQRKAV